MTKYLRHGLILVLLVFLKAPLRADSIPEIVAKAKPAVVEIVAADAVGTPKTLGTGFFISPDGLVVTNRHVIEGAGTITAVSNNGAIFLFERVVAQPAGEDLVVFFLKLHATDVPFLKLGKSRTAVEGQKVIVIGNPAGLMGTVSDGIISAFRQDRSLIQITAPISHGSSGSPVMDETGQVIGVATLISTEGQNLNFAIAAEKVFAALPQLQREQSSRPAPAVATQIQEFIEQKLEAWLGLKLNSQKTATPAMNAEAYFDRGLAFLGRENDKAISDFTEAIRLDPNYALAYFNRGKAYIHQGSFDKAVSDFTQAIRLDPNYALAYFNRGKAYTYQNYQIADDNAMSDFTEAIRLDPNFALAYFHRGEVYSNRGNHYKAISDYTEAIRLDPNDADGYYGRGYEYDSERQFDKAISDYNFRLAQDGSDTFTGKARTLAKSLGVTAVTIILGVSTQTGSDRVELDISSHSRQCLSAFD
jgi:tetratricopeptide (TPR) repeat protein